MRILITGGFGFVGGRLATYLIQSGHQIVLGSRNPNRSPEWLFQAEVAQIVWDDEFALEQSCSGIDVVIHAAGMNAHDCAADPVAALAFNGTSTARLAAAAVRAGVKKIIYLSTAHVYSSPLIGNITEECCPRNLHPYATSHLAGEHAILRVSQQRHIQGIVLRPSNIFGAPTHRDVNCWMLLINDLCKQAVETQKLRLLSGGLEQRDFISMTQVCQVVEFFAAVHTESVGLNTFNVGSGVSQYVFSVAELIQERCAKVLGFKPILQRDQGQGDYRLQALSYRSENLAALGVILHNYDRDEEIDNLLLFCQSEFSGK